MVALNKKQKIIASITFATLLIAVSGLVYYSPTRKNKDNTSTITASDSTKGEQTNARNKQDAASNETTGGVTDKNGDALVNGSSFVVAPTGTFISNHTINLSDISQLSVQSDCTTTPGIECTITFSQGSSVKSLPTKTTDAGGAAYWSWNIKDLGLTLGTWQIKATASSNNHKEVALDATNLEINQ